MPNSHKIHSELRHRAREFRKEMTPTETRIWGRLRNRGLGGLKFRRQHLIGRFIVDFCCVEARVVVEIDGGVHESQRERDAGRTEYLECLGYRVIRFRNDQVSEDLDCVLAATACARRTGLDE